MTTHCRAIEQVLQNIRALNPKLNAFVRTFDEDVRIDAKTLDDSAAVRLRESHLEGLPISFKDLFAIKNHRYTFGSLVPGIDQSSEEAHVVARLRQAGALIVGVNTLVEFALGAWGTNDNYGTPQNPRDSVHHRVAGGSSSGSAVAVAAGLVPVSIGTDTGGSVRIPAALCGVIGFKPSYGAIPTKGAASLNPSFDTVGIIASSMGDLARVFDVIKEQPDPSRLVATRRGLTIGFVGPNYLDSAEESVKLAYVGALEKLRSVGYKLQEMALPRRFEDYHASCGLLMSYESYSVLGDIAQRHHALICPPVLDRILTGKSISEAAHATNLRRRNVDIAEFACLFEECDFILSPAVPITAPKVTEIDESHALLSTFTRFVNYLNLCAMTIPISDLTSNMPVGLQITAKSGQDSNLLRFSRRILDLV